MPNRILQEKICTSETLSSVSAEAERLWYRLLVQADDFGRMDARIAVIRCRCFPLQLDSITERDVERALAELIEAGGVWLYEAKGSRVLQFRNWNRYNHLRNRHSKYPDWQGYQPGHSHPSELPADRDLQAPADNGLQWLGVAHRCQQLPALASNCPQSPAIASSRQQLHLDTDTDSETDTESDSETDKTFGPPAPPTFSPVRAAGAAGARGLGEDGLSGALDAPPTEIVDMLTPPAGANPLQVALFWLDQPTKSRPLRRDGHHKGEPDIVADLFVTRFGTEYPPEIARLGRLGAELSKDWKRLCKLIWNAPTVEGNAHDYLQKVVSKAKGRNKAASSSDTNGNGKGQNDNPVPTQMIDEGEYMRAYRERLAAKQQIAN